MADDLVVIVDDPLDGQVNQNSCDDPDGHDGDEGSEDLWGQKERIVSTSSHAHAQVRSHLGTTGWTTAGEEAVLTRSVPTKVHGLGGRSGGDPQGEQAHHHAAKVGQQVSCIGHDGQAVGQGASCKRPQAKRHESPPRARPRL